MYSLIPRASPEGSQKIPRLDQKISEKKEEVFKKKVPPGRKGGGDVRKMVYGVYPLRVGVYTYSKYPKIIRLSILQHIPYTPKRRD